MNTEVLDVPDPKIQNPENCSSSEVSSPNIMSDEEREYWKYWEDDPCEHDYDGR